ncbi:hypothetical protein GCM10007977_047920 [Dactylosporangium sucinum]|uniref:Integral membrane protein n=2 Tax=Dactylosporangium sucinum TaxID=1424081 RepID=A0A917TWZ6_9ACTN|nr:hypothetical protein GCM10007977_047920 [Dactylosporangium sucinum]
MAGGVARRGRGRDAGGMRWVYIGVGVLLILFGGVWTLQGLDVLGGSAMSGVTVWAVVGPVVALVGIVSVVIGLRRSRVD